MQKQFNTKRTLAWPSIILATVLLGASLTSAGAADLPDYMEQRGGVIYPVTGDSMQDIFRTPPHITDYLKPGMMIGVLPADCIPASGPVGDYFQCHHDLVLQPYTHDGQDVYMVIEGPR